MTPEQFQICKDFHLALIRATPSDDTVQGAEEYLVKGIKRSAKSKQRPIYNFAEQISDRFNSLVEWSNADTSTRFISIYNKNNTRNPADAVFYATFQVMNGGSIMDAMRAHGINYQCIKVLKPRVERWNSYSKMLKDTL